MNENVHNSVLFRRDLCRRAARLFVLIVTGFAAVRIGFLILAIGRHDRHELPPPQIAAYQDLVETTPGE